MTATTNERRQLTRAVIDALREVDDATFWREVVAYGYRRPARPDPDQAWFWTRSWISGELEADLNIAEGRTNRHLTTEEFLAELDRAAADADARRG
jgi:hypothetical protein